MILGFRDQLCPCLLCISGTLVKGGLCDESLYIVYGLNHKVTFNKIATTHSFSFHLV